MVKKILIGFAALLLSFVVISAVEGFNGFLYPLPEGVKLETREAIIQFVAQMPLGSVMLLFLGWMLGALTAGWFIGRFLKPEGKGVVAVVAGFAVFSTVLNFALIPHPLWVMAIGLLIPFPCAFAGFTLSKPFTRR